jgi:hypothetical protein
MRFLLAVTISMSVLVVPGLMTAASADTDKYCAASWKGLSRAERAKTTNKAYMASCLKGGPAVPATPAATADPSAKPTVAAAPTTGTAGASAAPTTGQ